MQYTAVTLMRARVDQTLDLNLGVALERNMIHPRPFEPSDGVVLDPLVSFQKVKKGSDGPKRGMHRPILQAALALVDKILFDV
jgi:hypothetical protein